MRFRHVAQFGAFLCCTLRSFSDDDKREIRNEQRRAYRWTFLVSGLEHPQFTEIVSELTDAGRDKMTAAAAALSA